MRAVAHASIVYSHHPSLCLFTECLVFQEPFIKCKVFCDWTRGREGQVNDTSVSSHGRSKYCKSCAIRSEQKYYFYCKEQWSGFYFITIAFCNVLDTPTLLIMIPFRYLEVCLRKWPGSRKCALLFTYTQPIHRRVLLLQRGNCDFFFLYWLYLSLDVCLK